MPHMLKAGMVLHPSHHRMIRSGCPSLLALLSALLVIFVIPATLVREVIRALVLMGATVILKAADDVVDVVGGVLIQLLVVAEDDDGDIDGAEDGEFVGLFEETTLALEEGDGSG
jgi:hypothetical protein